MKKILSILVIGIIFLATGIFCEGQAWVNEDINQGLNAKIETISPELKTYLNDVALKQIKVGFRDVQTNKDWKSEFCFRIDKNGKVYNKNYVIKGDYWVNSSVEYAMMKMNQLPAPPKEYKQEIIFVTFKHVNDKTEIYFSNVNEN